MYLPLDSTKQCLAFAHVQLSTLNFEFHENVCTEISFLNLTKQPILKSLLLLYLLLNLLETFQKFLTLILLHIQKIRFNIIDISLF